MNPPIELPPQHPFHGIATVGHDPSTGRTQLRFTDGRTVETIIGISGGAEYIRDTIFDVQSSSLRIRLVSGFDFIMKIGMAQTSADRPTVYLDQNHWIDMARCGIGSPVMSDERREVCQQITDLAERDEIILPVSAAHLSEIAKKGDRQRTQVAQVMMRLSKGWQMLSPLRVETQELRRIFGLESQALSRSQVFTLDPETIWSDHRDRRRAVPDADPMAAEMQGLIDRLSWATAMVETFVDTQRTISDVGLQKAESWAASFEELAVHVRGNPKAKHNLRDVTRTRLLSDIDSELAQAAASAGLTTVQFQRWLQTRAEDDLAAMPMLGRFRELVHLRVSNADDKWQRNDLNDTLYLCCAGAYADIIVGEKKMTSYLQRMKDNVTEGAQVFRRLEDALPAIESASSGYVTEPQADGVGYGG